MSPQHHTWTIMIYMAGKCGPTRPDIEVDATISQLRSVGVSDAVAILAQVHTLTGEPPAYRLHIRPADETQPIKPIPQQNTGDPASLRDFIIWGMEAYPAQHYALIIRSHGTGWNYEDVYAAVRQRMPLSEGVADPVRSGMRSSRRLNNALFLSSAVEVACEQDHTKRALAFDDASMAFLDNAGLQQALFEAAAHTGHKLDLLGLDACLMSMIEVAYQVRACADYLIASQELVPLMTGWPYKPTLQALVDDPTQTPDQFAQQIVATCVAYACSSMRGDPGLTRSAIRLGAVANLVQVLTPLSAALCQALETRDIYLDRALYPAWRRAKRFSDQDFVDLTDFLGMLRNGYAGSNAALRPLLEDALQWLDPQHPQGVIRANATKNRDVLRASGLSIYLPKKHKDVSAYYDRLDFAQCGWGDFLRGLPKAW